MLQKIICVAFISLLFLSCNKEHRFDCLKSTGKIVKQSRPYEYFYKVNLHDNVNLIIGNESPGSIYIEAGEHIIKNIELTFSNGELTIKNTNKCNWVRSYSKDINVYINNPDLYVFFSYGYGTIKNITPQSYAYLHLHQYGNGLIDLNIQADSTFMDMNSLGDVNLHGTTNVLKMTDQRLGQLNAQELQCKDAYLNSEGEGNIYVQVSNHINASISGKGNVYYQGSPLTDFTDIGEGNFIKQ